MPHENLVDLGKSRLFEDNAGTNRLQVVAGPGEGFPVAVKADYDAALIKSSGHGAKMASSSERSVEKDAIAFVRNQV